MDSNDVSYCSKIENKVASDSCITFYAAKFKDINACNLAGNRDVCYHIYANQTRDYDACYEISNEEYQFYCLGNSGVEYSSPEENDYSENQEVKEEFDLSGYGNYLI